MTDKVRATSRDYDIIRHPVQTEKSTMLLDKANAYVFVVDKGATKQDVKRAIERVFGVRVVSVNTITSKGKNKVFRGKLGKRSDFKKAIVRLEAGNRIELGVEVQ